MVDMMLLMLECPRFKGQKKFHPFLILFSPYNEGQNSRYTGQAGRQRGPSAVSVRNMACAQARDVNLERIAPTL